MRPHVVGERGRRGEDGGGRGGGGGDFGKKDEGEGGGKKMHARTDARTHGRRHTDVRAQTRRRTGAKRVIRNKNKPNWKKKESGTRNGQEVVAGKTTRAFG